VNSAPHYGLKTQIGGSYSPENRKLFPLKAALIGAGYDVRHPIGDRVVLDAGRWRAVCSDLRLTAFDAVEHHYYECIRDCHFHCVANFRATSPGTVGASAATEIGFAMLQAKPIILTDAIQFSESVDRELAAVIATRRPHLNHIEFALDDPQRGVAAISKLPCSTDYNLDAEAIRIISRCVSQLFDTL